MKILFNFKDFVPGNDSVIAVNSIGQELKAKFAGKNAVGNLVFVINGIGIPFDENGKCKDEFYRDICLYIIKNYDIRELRKEVETVANLYFTGGISKETINDHVDKILEITYGMFKKYLENTDEHKHLMRVKELIGDAVKDNAVYGDHVKYLLKELGLKFEE